MQILATTDFSTRSHRALRKAGLLARAKSAELTVLHVVDEDQPADLIATDSREAERVLAEQIKAMAELRDVRCRPMVIKGNPFDGVLVTARLVGADLIVMGAHRKQFLRDIFIGTTIERVIRAGSYPVLMVNDEAAEPYRNAIAAVEAAEPSVNAVRAARSMGLVDEGGITFLHAFLPLGKRKMSVAGVNEASIDSYVAQERDTATEELTAFLAANELGGLSPRLRVEEGEPFEVISKAVDEMSPDLLIIGTHGRTGLLKALLGSVTEAALRRLDIDILAVPPVRPVSNPEG